MMAGARNTSQHCALDVGWSHDDLVLASSCKPSTGSALAYRIYSTEKLGMLLLELP